MCRRENIFFFTRHFDERRVSRPRAVRIHALVRRCLDGLHERRGLFGAVQVESVLDLVRAD
jgi:hypothetical protein